jgi:DNA mismatch repair protein MutS2
MVTPEPDSAAGDLPAGGDFAEDDLEFAGVLGMLRARASTPMGQELAAALAPSGCLEEVTRRLVLLREGLQLAADDVRLSFPRLADPVPDLDLLAAPGAVLPADGLRNLASLAMAVDALRREVRPHGKQAPQVLGLVESVPDLAPFHRACRGVFTADGGLEDGASPRLKSLRHQVATTAERLRQRMSGLLAGPEADRYLRDEYVTQRNGRFVLPVRADHRRAVDGIVHGTSTSGATLYVEPLAMVEANNDLIRLQEAEALEEARILAELTDLAASLRPGFLSATAVVGRMDLLAASVRLAMDFDGTPAELASGGTLELVDARHLLLAQRLAEMGTAVVPLSVRLEDDCHVLVVSGPNTGGKTVALKTVGLAALMNQAGLAVPARRAVLPVFRQVLTDIGDHQSIQENLSTFSSHIRSLVNMTGAVKEPALVLVDELGTGTDPEEGAALGVAVVEYFRSRGGFVLVTTHHNGLKAYAETTPGVVNASVEFDEDSLEPTYRLLPGVAGRSGGLDIAGRLGLPATIVEHARRLVPESARQAQRYVARLADLVAEAEAARESAEAQRLAATEEARLSREATRRADSQRQVSVEAAIKVARQRMEKAGRAALERIEKEFGREHRRRAEEKARAEFSRLARREIARSGSSAPAVDEDDGGGEIRAGDRVRLSSTGHEGQVESVDDRGHLVVQVGHARLVTTRHEVRKVDARHQVAPAGRVTVRSSSGGTVAAELKLIGQRVADALEELDRYLDRALLAEHRLVRIVHGHGSGRLKASVRAHLQEHAAVDSFHPGGPGEGGDGATVVTLLVD